MDDAAVSKAEASGQILHGFIVAVGVHAQIAALLKGVKFVEGFDFDPDAVKMTADNLELNGFNPLSSSYARISRFL